MTIPTIVIDCPYEHEDGDVAICDLCGREIAPACECIGIRVGHMESPIGDNAADVCLDCARSRPGFVEAIAMLIGEISDKWEAKKWPRREFNKARAELNQRFREATSDQRRAFGSELNKLADEYVQATGENLSEYERRLDWINPF
jgi:hypothetical protein